MLKSNTAKMSKMLMNPNPNFYKTKERNYFAKGLNADEVINFPISAYSGGKNIKSQAKEHEYSGPYQF